MDNTLIAARADQRHAHHEAGHAVAAVFMGGYVEEISLGYTDWSDRSGTTDEYGYVAHVSEPRIRPFITFAGPWAEARWEVENGEADDMTEALEYAWDSNQDGDTQKYSQTVDQLHEAAAILGLPMEEYNPWEYAWHNELDDLWPVVQAVASLLLTGESVSHDRIETQLQDLTGKDE